ncbi:CocE/NonD family hydrolase [Mycobacterium tuberculosis]
MSTTSARPERPKLRALTGRVGGQALGGLLGLPRATTRYTVGHVRVPMRDGVQLVADHYAPATSQPVGTLLVRGPYGRRFPFSLVFARIYAARGYHVVLQSVRGTFGSGGVFEPMVNEAADGADTVAWLREQALVHRPVRHHRPALSGFHPVGVAAIRPPELAAAAVITVGPHDFRASVWGTGSYGGASWAGAIWFPCRKTPVASGPGIHQLTAPRRVASDGRHVAAG